MKNLRVKIEPTWSVEKIRRETNSLIGSYKIAMWQTLKDKPEELKKIQDCFFAERLENMRASNVETPLDLVNYLGELTANLGGANVSVSGNEKEASISYDDIPNWDSMKTKLELTNETKEKFLLLMKDSMQRFCEPLGFDCEVDARWDHPIARIVFRVKP
ncbi:MAG: hypothetical protein K2W95_27725 [Candidatus Obscuribacterales bacterium]|nr:hypothetical protein [Candidatus Obscuribacterales bacterium]